jgi:hypothetical protein
MPEWLIVLVVFFVMSRIVRKRRYGVGCGGRMHRLDRARERALSKGGTTRAVPAAPPESPMEALQRRYVDGSLTVEQYEAELDRLYRSS